MALDADTDPGKLAAIEALGGVRKLARAIRINHTTILRWKLIPVDYLFQIEELTGIPREKLRPDIFKMPRPKARAKSQRG